MFNGFGASYSALVAFAPNSKLVSPFQLKQDPALDLAVSVVDSLGKLAFAKKWPELNVRWGIEFNEHPNASVSAASDGNVYVVLTSGACKLLASVGAFVAEGGWLERELYPRLSIVVPPSSLSSQDVGEFALVLGLAALFGHELGHAADRFFRATCRNEESLVNVAEEISADGHGIRVGLAIVDSWAADRSSQTACAEGDFRLLGATLLVLANAALDNIKFGAPWQPEPGMTHPPGVQRLMGACVHVQEHLKGHDTANGVNVFMAVLSGLAEMRLYGGPVDHAALRKLISDYDSSALLGQYSALCEVLRLRGLG